MLIAAIERWSLGAKANPKGFGGWLWVASGKMVFVPTYVGDPQVCA